MEKNQEELREIVIKLFEDNIFPQIIGDLKELDVIQPGTHKSSCAVPTAMLIFAALDLIGYLIKSEGKWDESELNIKRAVTYNQYFPKLYEDNVHNLVVFYRHGLMHSIYPIQKKDEVNGIHKSNTSMLFETIKHGNNEILSLNVNVLSEDFKVFINNLYQEVKSTNELSILKNISNGFMSIYDNSITTTDQTTIPIGVRKNKSKMKENRD